MEPANRILRDEEIVSRILKGETQLYEHLIRKFNTRLYRISMSIIKDDMEAEDIMQTAYINAFRQLHKFERRSGFGTWLTRIVINESLLQKKKKERSLKLTADQIRNQTDDRTPLKDLMNKELKDILEKAVFNLPEKYRLVFIMREVQEMSTSETMEVLDLGESNVKVRLNRAKEMLREQLSNYYRSTELFQFNLVRCDKMVHDVMERLSEPH